MLTQCPNCETTFRVTADILRVADGQVRCGRCHTQFDALERLIADGDAQAAESGRFLQTSPEPDTAEVDEPESMDEISDTYRAIEDADEQATTHREATEEWAEFDEPTDEAVADSAIAADEPDERDFEPQPARNQPQRATRAPLGSRLRREAPAEPEQVDDMPIFAARPPRRTGVIWKVLVAPLALLLIAQLIHHYRSDLARHPRLGAPLMSTYRALGLQLTPDWDLHAYGVKQWGVVMDPSSPGTLIVRASITNNAAFAQPYPLLKLVLEDRWGDQVRAREFEPTEYLDPGVSPDRLLGPAQQTNATLAIMDPGPDAEGFRFDVCLRGRAAPVCAADVPTR